jgi:cytochrome c556
MKTRLLLSALVLALVSVSSLRAEDAKPAAAVKADKPETELEQTMGKMNKAWRQVRKAARDGKLTPATADLVATVRTNAESAAKLTPALEADKPEADRAKFQADYQAQIKKLTETLAKLEDALKANDTAGATKLVADVGDLMKSGHHDFKKPEKKD